MSGWDAWADNLTHGGAACCGIAGADGNPWAVKNSPTHNSAECKEAVDAIKGQKMEIFGTGMKFLNKRWVPLRMENDLLVMKGKDEDNKEQVMTICLTKSAVVYGCNPDASVQGNQVRAAVEKLKCDLENAGY